ncbi:hypothetical protein [Candidatus Chlorohelix sp.]|jgi:hypothetical protein|uniref:hypothetical protein n=1 Tax=Candidatus Chlorohelix sp. TaxID=3139201 RepID=UPI0030535FCF
MAKWEYCCVIGMGKLMRNLEPSFPAIWFFREDGIEIVDIKSKTEGNDVAKVIARLGLEGWEMVGAGNNGTEHHSLYFKKPKE